MLHVPVRVAFLVIVLKTCLGQHTSSSHDWHFAGPNVALGKPAEQHPGVFQNQNASHAVDGNTTYTDGLRHCSHTGKATSSDFAWWRVDLGDYYCITGIRIYNRDASYRARLRGFIISGNTSQGASPIYNSTDTEYNQTIINVTVDGTPPFNSITIALPPYRSESYLALCEVEVYALGCPVIHTIVNQFTAHLASNSSQPVYSDGQKIYNTFNTVLNIQCNPGYSPRDHFSIQCQPNGSYNVSQPFCIQNYCNQPSRFANGSYTSHQSTYQTNDVIVAECNTGYMLQGDRSRTCQLDGTWSGVQPVCSIVMCSVPTISHGHFVLNNNTLVMGSKLPYQTILYITCSEEGYTVTITSIRCESNGQWNGTGPFCRITTCTQPKDLQHGHYIYSNGSTVDNSIHSYQYNTMLRASCHEGYIINETSNNLTCNSDGKWTPIITCSKETCLTTFNNGYYKIEGGNSNVTVSQLEDVLSPHCINDSFRLITQGKGQRICMANGVLNGAEPTCVPLCKSPHVENGVYLNENRTNGVYFQQCERLVLKCFQGFEVSKPNGFRTCQADHTWSGELNACTETKQAKSASLATIGGIGGGTAGVAIVLVVLGLIVYRRRSAGVRSPTERKRQSIELPTTNTSMTINTETGNDYTDIPVVESDNHVYNTIQPEQEQVSDEYYNLKVEQFPQSAIRTSSEQN